ncbi:MAG: hypothetical protein R2698_10690 [Microthrixaceae bacterium]
MTPAPFDVQADARGVTKVRGEVDLAADNGDTVRLNIDVRSVGNTNIGSIRVKKADGGGRVPSMFFTSPRIEVVRDGSGGWSVTLDADGGSFYRGKWYHATSSS